MTIVEFLEARIADGEYWAQRAAEHASREADDGRIVVRRWLPKGMGQLRDDPRSFPDDPARVLRECAAKRQVIEASFELAETVDGEFGCGHMAEEIRRGEGNSQCEAHKVLVAIVSPLAAIYSDHPDYRPEWPILARDSYIDNFDRADGTLGASWTTYSSTLGIVANKVGDMAQATRALTQVSLQLGDAIFELPPHVRVRAGDVVSWNRDRENRPVGDGKNVRVLVTRDDETVYEGPAVRRDSHPDYREEWRD